ncbi:MAG: hypothetical protein IKS19_05295 [Clostridia bacterium]|nr:hypothetical protein [Clostridia bacterium]
MHNQTGARDEKLLHMRIQTALLGCILLIILAVGVFAAVEFSTVHRSLALIETDVRNVEVDQINEAVEALTAAANKLTEADVETLNETAASLRDAANMLAGLDTDGINDAVRALTEAANKLSELDIESLNGLVSALESTAQRLQNTANSIATLGGLLGR